MKKIDSMVRLFDGDLSFTELMAMDIPLQNAMINARLENLRQSKEAYIKNGITDSYSKSYVVNQGFGGMLPSTPPETKEAAKEKYVKNARAAGLFQRSNF